MSVKNVIALSISWNSHKYDHAEGIIREIAPAKINALELSFNLTGAMVGEFAALARSSGLSIVSLHNYCPVPNDLPRFKALPDCYSMASLDERIRAKAVFHTKNSIDTAKKIGAKVVVLHCGRVEIPDATKELTDLGPQSELFESKKKFLLADRIAQAQKYFQSALSSLEELNAYAKKKNIFLGVENRYYLSEIPSFEEVAKILAHFGNSNIFYWHDFGHAQIFQNLGVCKQSDYLQAGGQRLIGVHIHDVKGFQDHLPLGKGAIDYLRYKSIIQDPKVLKVLEIHGPASIDEIVESKKQIEKIIADPRC